MPKFGMKVPHVRCDLHTSFKVKESKVRVTRPMTHIVDHILRVARRTIFKLGTRMEYDDPHQPQVP